MTLFEHEQRRSRRKHHKRNRRKPVQPKWSVLDAAHPNQVLTFHEWCQLNRISTRTGRRIIKSGTGPTVTQLSPRRIGISVGNNAAWQAARERK